MSKKKPLYIMLVFIVLLVGILTVPAIADAGNFSGHSDYGGSFGGSSGGSFDSSGLWALVALSNSGGGTGGIITIIIIAYIILNILKKRKNTAAAGAVASDFSELMPIHTIRDIDPNFSEAEIKEKVANLYVQMQDAWQNKKFGTMRPYMTDALYSQFERQLQELIRSGCTNYIDRIVVLDVRLAGWKADKVNDSIIAVLSTRIVDYTVNDKTGKVVSGSKTAEKFMTYEWTLIRSKGMKTPAAEGEKNEGPVTLRCPSCGAPVDINQSAKCPYCDSVINAGDYDWSISAIKGISQRTKY